MDAQGKMNYKLGDEMSDALHRRLEYLKSVADPRLGWPGQQEIEMLIKVLKGNRLNCGSRKALRRRVNWLTARVALSRVKFASKEWRDAVELRALLQVAKVEKIAEFEGMIEMLETHLTPPSTNVQSL